RIGRYGPCDLGQLLSRRLYLQRAQCFTELVASARAHQWNDAGVLGGRASEHPGDGQLRDRCAHRLRDPAQLLDEGEIDVEVLTLKARRARAKVARAALPAPMATDQSASQHPIGGDADAELAADRHDLPLDAA